MSTRSQVSASEQDISDGMAELELQKLQRQYRIMEGDRKAYSEESRIMIGKQRASIEKLKRDNGALADELRLLEKRTEEKKQNGAFSKKAEALTEQADAYQKKIRLISAEITALDGSISMMSKEIDGQRANLGGIHAASQNNDAILKSIRVLENRLDKALVKFNNALAVNKSLRGSIDNLRRERLVFDNIYRKFERDVLEQKKQMADIIENSNAAYEARDEAQAKIIALREKTEKEQQNYNQEMKELDRTLEQDRKLKEFMAKKIADRNGDLNTRVSELKPITKESQNAAKSSSNENISEESVESYQKAFEEIRQVTQISDISDLVQKFKEVEDQNFSLFNFVNEINNEIEMEAENIVSIQHKIDSLKIENMVEEKNKNEKMKVAEEKMKECEQKKAFYTTHIQKISQLLDDVQSGITSLQDVILSSPRGSQASSEDSTTPIPKSSGSPYSNLISTLGYIEYKTNELLTLHLAVNSPKNRNQIMLGEDGLPKDSNFMNAGTVGGLLGQGPTAPIGKISILAPSTGDDHDSDDALSDEDERPLSRDEIKARTLKGLSRRAEKSAITNPTKNVAVKKSKRRGKKLD